MYKDWIKEKQTATDHDIEKYFQIKRGTLKEWRLKVDIDSPMHFRLGDTILYPRAAFVEWFERQTKNKKASVVGIVGKRPLIRRLAKTKFIHTAHITRHIGTSDYMSLHDNKITNKTNSRSFSSRIK